jgi:hypothetical protein
MANYGIYATYEEVKTYLQGVKAGEFPKDDSRIIEFTFAASRRFDEYCKRKFYPTRETRYYNHPGAEPGIPVRGTMVLSRTYGNRFSTVTIQDDCLKLDSDLLEAVTITTANGDTTLATTDYYLTTGGSYNTPPYDRVELRSDGDVTAFAYSDSPQRANAITGFWGYHQEWGGAWVAVDTIQNNPLTISGTSLTVADVDGADDIGQTPRFRVHQLIRFGTGTGAEYAFITAKNTQANTLTIVRGVNGTTAAQQAATTAIYVYRPMWQIVDAVKMLAAHLYRRKDNVGGQGESGFASSTGVLVLPPKLPSEVAGILAAYKRTSL